MRYLTIKDFPAIITTTRQRKISLSLVIQATSQLEERYGKQGVHTILNGGVASRLYFSGMDIGTAEEFSRTIGEIHLQRDILGNSVERQPLMNAPALRAMPDNQAIYLYANRRPALLHVTPYYQRKNLVRRTETPPTQAGQGAVPERVELVPM